MIELRIALVCYGGVSLAVYMHGVTKEIEKLVSASEALGSGGDPPELRTGSTRVYWNVLREIRERDLGDAADPGMRVVVDIIAGTSAGGINGVILAKALALGQSQEALREVWIDQGSLLKLLHGNAFVGRILAWFSRGRASLLDGDWMLDRIVEVLQGMDKNQEAGAPSLVPPDVSLDLFVTTTDLNGVHRRLPVWDPLRHAWARIDEAAHAHVLAFHHPAPPGDENRDPLQPRPSDFRNNLALAFAARATSSFPVAFPPVRVSDVVAAMKRWAGRLALPADPEWPERERQLESRFFPRYRLAGQSLDTAAFIDGGVLRNKPFAPAVAAVRGKPAKTEVQRRLVYLEPAPESDQEAFPQHGENPFSVAWAAWHGLPTLQPIAEDLAALEAWNHRVNVLDDLIDSVMPEAKSRLAELSGAPSVEQIQRRREQVYEEVRSRDPSQYADYERFKLIGVVEQAGWVVAAVLHYPVDSLPAEFISRVFWEWAKGRGLVGPPVPPDKAALPRATAERARDFLRAFDVGYRVRRLRLVIRRLNRHYPKAESPTTLPRRGDLNRLKRALYAVIVEFERLANGERLAAPIRQGIEQLFALEKLRRYLDRDDCRGFVEDNRRALDDIAAQVGDQLAQLGASLLRQTETLLASMWTLKWRSDIADDLLIAYLNFPVWDVRTYPINILGGVSGREIIRAVRISPQDAVLLSDEEDGAKPRAKLQGAGFGHFQAFFRREYREHDYLIGRLDAAERLIDVVGDALPEPMRPSPAVVTGWKLDLFDAVLDEERDHLAQQQPLISTLKGRVAKLRAQLARPDP